MAEKTEFILVEQTDNVFEISFLTDELTESAEDEFVSMSSLLFFQSRNHIQVDLSSLSFVPFSFLLRLLNLAKDLRAKKRVLVLVGIPYSQFHFLDRFQLQKVLFETESGFYRSLKDVDYPKEESLS